MSKTLINVSNRLPVTVSEDKISKSSGGLVAALEGLSADEYQAKWIGWPGGEIAPERQEEVARTLQDEHGCIPVFLSEEEETAFYEGFANSSVWPLFHDMPTYLRYEPDWWKAYQKINQRFADQVLAQAQEGDIVWVHDYQLLLLPALLKAAKPSLRIGFFLHTPFPSFEVFRYHPRRRELIEGMLGADLLGFHTFSYLRHFRGAALRLVEAEAGITHLRCADDHEARLGVYPIGINAAKFDETLDAPEHAKLQAKFRQTFQGKKLVLSIERMDYTKGILHRLDAVDCFLAERENLDDIKFLFVSVPSREGVEEYQTLREDVESRIGRINGKYATLHNSPIHFVHDSVEFPDLCAMYSVADVCMVTPLIDGMNLVAKEFLACQREPTGPLILSEFAGAAEELSRALVVNPYDAPAVARCVQRALDMPPRETAERNGVMRERTMRLDAGQWAKTFLADLEQTPTEAVKTGQPIEGATKRLRQALAAGKPVWWFLDYDGTVRGYENDPAAAAPDGDLLTLLDKLAEHDGCRVTIVSGRSSDDLEQFFPGPTFGLVAEHGASRRLPGAKEWETLDGSADYAWKDEVRRVFDWYVEAVPGSRVEEKRTSLVWHYRGADPEFGVWKARQLAEELGSMVSDAPVRVRRGRKMVEAVSAQVSKGAVVQEAALAEAGLVVCAGDDLTDESMFADAGEGSITIRVGDGHTRAAYRVEDTENFRQFLREVTGS